MEARVKLLGKQDAARETKTFFFAKPSGFSFIAGQYCYFTLPKLEFPDSRGDTRHFTLSSSPTEDHLSLTTRMRKDSGWKKTLDNLPEGVEVVVRGPNGDFVLEDEATQEQQVMMAGGIGVTPYRSIIRYVADKNLPIPIHLIYSNSLPEDIAFKEEFDRIVKEHPNIKVSYTVTKPEESHTPWTGLTGRIDENLIRKLANPRPGLGSKAGNWKLETGTFWLCGPPAMVSSLEELLAKMKIPAQRTKVEKFTGY